jgi:hypothetical protein
MQLPADLCCGLPTVPAKTGLPKLPPSDAFFNITFKVYSTFSQRRFMSALRQAHVQGYISKVPFSVQSPLTTHLEGPFNIASLLLPFLSL